MGHRRFFQQQQKGISAENPFPKVSVKRKGGVLPVVGFTRRLANPSFALDENSCQASLPGQIGPNDDYFLSAI